jgi:hypothetical protein
VAQETGRQQLNCEEEMYKLIESGLILRLSDNAYIPFDPDNTDYQQYLKWIEEGNTPEPAENT